MKKETNPKKTIPSKKQPKALKKGSLKKTSGGGCTPPPDMGLAEMFSKPFEIEPLN
ncbi:MAG: hypothetical protein P4L16_07240 [Chlamydiales bacterium]|nr:hypothetical protein [Chlamydiales bacterium]